MLFRLRTSAFALGALLLGASATNSSALVLDWSAVSWTNQYSNTFDVDPNVINDITVKMTGNLNRFTNDTTSGVATPAITTTLQGGLGAVPALQLAANLGTNSLITVSVDFSAQYTQGVENVSFTLFDIDAGADLDRIINIYATALDGTTHLAATISNLGSTVTLTGTGLTQVLSGNAPSPDTSANGNATFSFGANAIIGFSFSWENSNGPPKYQDIAMGNISFTPVPEVNPTVAAATACLFAMLAMKVRRAGLSRCRSVRPRGEKD
ncbi:MAG: hypothetical protein QOH88_2475 [Verrucomicrobiota bacterium]|jgi:hypothetical protein